MSVDLFILPERCGECGFYDQTDYVYTRGECLASDYWKCCFVYAGSRPEWCPLDVLVNGY